MAYEYKGFTDNNQPIVGVSWHDARDFCKWAGGRLPGEAEWEYAARGGGKPWRHPWGNTRANCTRAVLSEGGNGCGRGTTWPVCSKKEGNSVHGLCDMAGNVFEWVEDCSHTTADGRPSDERPWIKDCYGARKGILGRSFIDLAIVEVGTASSSGAWFPTRRANFIGIRCAANPLPQTKRANLVWIELPRGNFLMGSTSAGKRNSMPARKLKLLGYQVMRSEATVGQYRSCLKAGKCTEPGTGQNCNWGVDGREKHPINCVNWYQSKEFCSWIGGRLPSEAEWEYIARDGKTRWLYPWGNQRQTCSNTVFNDRTTGRFDRNSTPQRWVYDGCAKGSTWEVCTNPKGNNSASVCNLVGNVKEWVEDCWHGTYAGRPTDNRSWVLDCHEKSRVVRGDSWQGHGVWAGSRWRWPADTKLPSIGFRCVRQEFRR